MHEMFGTNHFGLGVFKKTEKPTNRADPLNPKPQKTDNRRNRNRENPKPKNPAYHGSVSVFTFSYPRLSEPNRVLCTCRFQQTIYKNEQVLMI